MGANSAYQKIIKSISDTYAMLEKREKYRSLKSSNGRKSTPSPAQIEMYNEVKRNGIEVDSIAYNASGVNSGRLAPDLRTGFISTDDA